MAFCPFRFRGPQHPSAFCQTWRCQHLQGRKPDFQDTAMTRTETLSLIDEGEEIFVQLAGLLARLDSGGEILVAAAVNHALELLSPGDLRITCIELR
jgi:hypothetical protein